MIPAPPSANPWAYTQDLPPQVPNGLAGVFVAWGFLRSAVNDVLPSSTYDMLVLAGVNSGPVK